MTEETRERLECPECGKTFPAATRLIPVHQGYLWIPQDGWWQPNYSPCKGSLCKPVADALSHEPRKVTT